MVHDILLYTDSIHAATDEIESRGGRLTQRFTDRVFVAEIPEQVDVTGLRHSTTVRPADLDRASVVAADAWAKMLTKTQTRRLGRNHGLAWDAPGHQPPCAPTDTADGAAPSTQSTGTPTSLYMTGSVAVGVVVVSGTPSDLGFSTGEQQTVVAEIQEGLRFLIGAEQRADLSFYYDINFVTVDAQPGTTDSYESAEAPWRDAALVQMGFDGSRSGSVDYVNKIREDLGTDWAYVAYFTKYGLHKFGYAGDERIVMNYLNGSEQTGNWDPDDISRVFAHETGHIFGALDEYADSLCTCGEASGYFQIVNNNCEHCPGDSVPCVMNHNDLSVCSWSRGQFGWDDQLIGFQDGTPVTAIARMTDHLDVFAVNKMSLTSVASWSETWDNWVTVSAGRFPVGTRLTALARMPGHIDVFALGGDGRVHTTWWDGSWHGWGPVADAVFFAGTTISAIARGGEHIDLFAVGNDGRVYTTWWDGSWHGWSTVADAVFLVGTPVAAITRKQGHIDLFAVGNDGRVYTTWWDGGWHGWGTVDAAALFPVGSSVTAVARTSEHIDLFAVGNDGRVHTTWWDGGWHGWGFVEDAVFPAGTTISAIARKPDHIDLFAVGGDGRVYTTWWDGSWHDWGTVADAVFPAGTAVAAVARMPEHVDLFAVRDESVFTTWWDGVWHPWGRIGNSVALAEPVAELTHFAGAVRAGTTAFASIELPAPAPEGGHLVTFASSHPAVASVPGGVKVPAGTRTASLPIQVAATAQGAQVTLTAKDDGQSRSAALDVLPHRTRQTALGTMAEHHTSVLGLAAVGRYVYATHYFSRVDDGHSSPAAGDVVVIDTTTAMEVPGSRVSVGYQPRNIAINPVTRRAYVTNYGMLSYSVSILDLANPTKPAPAGEVAVGQVPIDVAVHPGRNRVYVTNPFQKRIHVIDGSTGVQLTPILLDAPPYAIAIDPGSDTLYVTLYDLNVAPIVNAVGIVRLRGESRGQTQTEIQTLPLYENPDAPDPSRPVRPWDLAVDAVHGTLYVANLGGGDVAPAVTVLDLATHEQTRVRTSAPARAIAYAPSVEQVFVGTDNGVQTMDAPSRTIAGMLVGGASWGVCVTGTGAVRAYAGTGFAGVVTELTAPELSQPVHWA